MSEATLEQKMGLVPAFDPNAPQQAFPQWPGQIPGNVPNPFQAPPPAPQQVPVPEQMPTQFQNPQPQYQPQPAQQYSAPQYVPVQQTVTAPQQNFAPPQYVPVQQTVTAPQQNFAPPQPQPQPQPQQLPTFNAPEGASAPVEPKRGRGRPAGTTTSNKKLEKITSDRLAFLIGVHAGILSGLRNPAQLQECGDACLLALKSKFGE